MCHVKETVDSLTALLSEHVPAETGDNDAHRSGRLTSRTGFKTGPPEYRAGHVPT